MATVSSYPSITLNINESNFSNKRHKNGWRDKNRTQLLLPQETHLKFKDTSRLKGKKMGKIHTKRKQKKAVVAVLIPHKI